MSDYIGSRDIWMELERRMRFVEGAGISIGRLKDIIDGRMPEGKRLMPIEGEAYERLLSGLEADVLYLIAKDRRKEAARGFWKVMGNPAGDPSDMEVDYEELCVRSPSCAACTMFYLGSTFETAEFEPGEIETHYLPQQP